MSDVIAKIAEEAAWLAANPAFLERPATFIEFLRPDYLNIEAGVRDAIKRELSEIIGHEVSGKRITKWSLAIITGGIGIGKTTIASIVLPYLAHWVLCLKDPQGFFGLLPGSRIAFMMMSTSEQQALEVVFGDVDARIKHSPWFKKHPRQPNLKKQIKFTEKDIWIIPGDSAETTFEGYNILGGILDEADSHKVTKEKDYAELGYDTINNRISSRFQDRGCLVVIGQMKSASGFAARKYAEFRDRSDAYAVRMTIWDSMGEKFFADETGYVDKFAYDTKRKQIIPTGAADMLGPEVETIIRIPRTYEREFINNPEKALKDLAGIPPAVGDPFISLVDRLEECAERWVMNHGGLETPVTPEGRIEPWLVAPDPLQRCVHVDIGYASGGDAMGIAMGHVREMVKSEDDDELQPYIVIDFLMRLTAPAGGEIFLGDMRRIIYELRGQRKFKIVKATLDGFQSQDTIQQLRKRKIPAEYLTMDRLRLPYEDLREAVYDRRIEWPKYMVRYSRGHTALTDIALKETMELVDAGTKIDHPPLGSKDVADAIAGVVTTLMGERKFRRQKVNLTQDSTPMTATYAHGGFFDHPAVVGGALTAPIPPQMPTWNGRR